jgi:hypothetical protein
MRPEDRHELRQKLERSMKSVQDAVQIIDAQPGISPDLKALRGKLAVISTMAEIDLKQGQR